MTTSSATDDPYYVVRDQILHSVEVAKKKNAKLKELLEQTTSESDAELKETKKGVTKELNSSAQKLKQLRAAVEYVQQNRDKYTHIQDSELKQRRDFIREMTEVMNKFKTDLENPALERRLQREAKAVELGATNERELTNSRLITDSKQQVQITIHQQDQAIAELGQAVDTLRPLADNINAELREQNILLENVENQVDDANQRMGSVMERLGKLLKTKDKCQIWTIVVLALVLVLLVVLTIYT